MDTVYWSARAPIGAWFEDLRSVRAQAGDGHETVPWRVASGFALDVLGHGAFRYPLVVECAEFRAHLTDSGRLPTAWVQLRSAYIHEVGVERAIEESAAVVGEIVGARITEAQASRVDLYADLGGWSLCHRDREGLVTHADLHAHFRAGTEEIETVQAGKSPFLVRCYRKDLEIRERGGFAPVFWQGWEGPVTRVEVQVGSEKLRAFGLSSVADVLTSRGDLWRHATTEFLELRVPRTGPRESWSVRPEWRIVQDVQQAFPASGVVPYVVLRGDRLRLLRALYGYLTSLGAIDGTRELPGVLRALPAELVDVARGRTFGEEVERKRRRLPRAVRSPVDCSPASAGPGKEAPWAPDLSQGNTRTDA